MGEIGIWLGIIIVGVTVLGVVEYVRTNATIIARREDLITMLMAVTLIVLTVTAAFVAVTYIIVVLFFEFWVHIVIASLVIAGIAALVHRHSRPPL